MNKTNKRILWITGVIVLLATSAYVWNYLLSSIGSSICENQLIESINSPDNLKKVVIFSTDCGATSDWSIHASLLDKDQSLGNNSAGNALRLNSNQGKAWPRDNYGRPVIKATWLSPTSVNLQYSMNSEVFYQRTEVNGVQITLVPLTN
jgi:hypothetical protein